MSKFSRPVQRLKLTIAYRGTRYYGWQRQAVNEKYKGPPIDGENLPTIQEIASKAISSVVRHPIVLVGSSRTDARVHAKGQLAHFDTDQKQIPLEGIRRAVNHALPDDILIRSIQAVPASFNAVLSTTSKRYQYAVWNAPDRPVFFADLAMHRWQPLDVEAMARGASQLVGTHDFASFAKPGHGRENTVRTILACHVARRGRRLVIGVEGTGFLWNMVRIIAGTLIEVGLGKFAPEDVGRMLAARDRRAAGSTAPAHGLYLQWIKTRDEDAVAAGPRDFDQIRPHDGP
ncbi:MAG TPA: tRNA pseudouridine(38-40) synthase TruA [Tepidisphaeraceae bacterium]|nr:tRNA pseudouridine(38-40) synthase TruA [Tepidisphaeraceae bacterium]